MTLEKIQINTTTICWYFKKDNLYFFSTFINVKKIYMFTRNIKGPRKSVFRSMSEPLISEKELRSDSQFIPADKPFHKYLKKGEGKLASNYQDEESEFSKKRKQKIYSEQYNSLYNKDPSSNL